MKKENIKVFSEEESFPNSLLKNFYSNFYQDHQLENHTRIVHHQHTYYEIIWVENGKGVHSIDLTDYEYSGPCLFLLHPKNVHRIYKKEVSKGGVIKFNDSFFDTDEPRSRFLLKFGIFSDVDVFPVINLTSDEANEIRSYFEFIHSQTKTNQLFNSTLVLNLLKSLLLKIYQFKKKNISVESRLDIHFTHFNEFQELLEQQFNQQYPLSFYSEKLKISLKTLNEVCKKFGHKTAHQTLKERLLLEAKRMLIYTHFSIKEIAFKLGFEDASYFTRFFTASTKLSPKEFKKQHA